MEIVHIIPYPRRVRKKYLSRTSPLWGMLSRVLVFSSLEKIALVAWAIVRHDVIVSIIIPLEIVAISPWSFTVLTPSVIKIIRRNPPWNAVVLNLGTALDVRRSMMLQQATVGMCGLTIAVTVAVSVYTIVIAMIKLIMPSLRHSHDRTT